MRTVYAKTYRLNDFESLKLEIHEYDFEGSERYKATCYRDLTNTRRLIADYPSEEKAIMLAPKAMEQRLKYKDGAFYETMLKPPSLSDTNFSTDEKMQLIKLRGRLTEVIDRVLDKKSTRMQVSNSLNGIKHDCEKAVRIIERIEQTQKLTDEE